MAEYKVIRSYNENHGEAELQLAFRDGWKPVWGSDYVPKINNQRGYIEYILKKEEK